MIVSTPFIESTICSEIVNFFDCCDVVEKLFEIVSFLDEEELRRSERDLFYV